jgi:hypothetical protein
VINVGTWREGCGTFGRPASAEQETFDAALGEMSSAIPTPKYEVQMLKKGLAHMIRSARQLAQSVTSLKIHRMPSV